MKVLKRSQLEKGHRYYCTLSDRHVLITIDERDTMRAEGYVYNPITGKYDVIYPEDYQLGTYDQLERQAQ